MALASLIDAGADIEEVSAGLRSLPVGGWHMEAAKTTKCGLVATQVGWTIDPDRNARAHLGHHPGHHRRRRWPSARPRRQRAQEVFAALAVAEGRLHGVVAEDVRFHEVGGVDAIVDVVGTCLALESLGVVRCARARWPWGQGRCGRSTALAQPSSRGPGAALGGARLRHPPQEELTTPTGGRPVRCSGRVLRAAAPVRLTGSGYGAGAADLDGTANVLQVVIGELQPAGG